MRPTLLLLCVCLLMACTWGCAALQPTAFPAEMSTAFKQIGTSIADQADWERVLARLDGHVSNPGFRGGAGIEYFAYGQIIGADGSIKLEGDGSGSTLSDSAREVILRLAEEPDALDKILTFIKEASIQDAIDLDTFPSDESSVLVLPGDEPGVAVETTTVLPSPEPAQLE